MSTTPTIRPAAPQPVAQPRTEAQAPAAAPAQTQSAPASDRYAASDRPSGPRPQLSGADRSSPVLSSMHIGEEIPQRRLTNVRSLTEPAAQEAIAKTADGINEQMGPRIGGRDAATTFVPRSVETDDLGMTHVRMDRTHNSVPVLGEQVIGHLGQDGNLSSLTGDIQQIPAELGRGEPKVSQQQAIDAAMKSYGQSSDVPPSADRVIVQGADGQYRDAYRVQTQNFQGVAPERQNFLVDANTGEVFENWNQMTSFFDKDDLARMEKAGGASVAQPAKALEGGEAVHVEKTESPAAPIQDFQTTTSKIELGDDATVDSLKLNVDIDHTWKGDLLATLTSPSGKSVTFSNREGGSQDNIKGTFDLSEAFKGEDMKGTWTLSVADQAGADKGTLNSWGLSIDGKSKGDPKPPEGNDSTIFAGKVEVGGTDVGNGQQKLLDSTRGQGVEVRDANNRSSGSSATEMTDNNGSWGEATDPARQKGAVDAMYGAQQTYDFYKEILGRDSIDGKGEKLRNNVHINTNYVNAFWDGSQMNYGDGNGRDANSLTTLDVAGHEITHGLTQRTANLVYRNESGGINESMSDIMGAGVEWYAMKKNPELAKNGAEIFKVGEQTWTPATPGDALRFMDDPTKDNYSIDNYKNYPKQTEVHGSSGIMNNAFYLMVNGGTNKTSGLPVGGMKAGDPAGFDGAMDKSLKIFGRALTNYMTPNTTFAQARTATIQAATDLYGADSDAVKQVKDAWTAVGVN